MKSRIWRLAGVGLLCMGVGAPALADERDNGRGPQQGGPREQGQSNEIIRGDNSRQFEPNRPSGAGQQLYSPPQDPNAQGRPAPQNNLPIQSRPDSVRQTQDPQRGYYQDMPRRPGDSYYGTSRPGDNRWPGRPGGHGNGWGPGPQYRPGHETDRFPERNYRVPYHGQDYFYSAGYWYRPQGPRYVVVRPPYGIRVSYLPDYAREMWIGGSLFFLAAGAYYLYEPDTRQYVVVQEPVQPPPPASNGYDVLAYPANGQSPEQIQQDGDDCYRWAVQQSGFDPATVTYAPAPAVVQAYRQAKGGCLASRGYQVTY